MTIGETKRAIESKRRVKKIEAQERATLDYIMADLIGRSVARIYSSTEFPKLEDVYPMYFEKEEIKQAEDEKRMQLSIDRFQAFAESFNKRFDAKEGKELNDE